MSSSTGVGPENEPGESSSTSSTVRHRAKPIQIDGRGSTVSVAFLADGKHIVSGGDEKKMRRWRVEDGAEDGEPVDARSHIWNVAASRDGKWVVSGAESGEVTVSDFAENDQKTTAFRAHNNWIWAVDVSPDGTRVATGSRDQTVSIFSISTGSQLSGPFLHEYYVVAVKFSPDGRLIATGTWCRESVRVYDSQNGRLLFDVPIKVGSPYNQSLAWTSDSKQLFALSNDSTVTCLDASTGATLAEWSVHSDYGAKCIALASNGTFIATAADSLVSFWDTTTHEKIGSVVQHPAPVLSMALSANYDLVIGGGRTITLRNLCDIVPSSYFDNSYMERARERLVAEKADLEKTVESLRTQEKNSSHKIARLEEIVHQLRNQLSDSQSKADGFNKTIEFLNVKITQLDEQLRTQHADSQHRADGLARMLCAYEKKPQCEALYTEGRIIDAALSLLDITNIGSNEIGTNRPIMDWVAEFRNQCISTLEKDGDKALDTDKHDEAIENYSTALLLSPSTPNTLLAKWAGAVLNRRSANEALSAAAKFNLPSFLVYRATCDVLEEAGRVSEAMECFQRLQSERREDTGDRDGQAQPELGEGFQRQRDTMKEGEVSEIEWVANFKARCLKTLTQRGDIATDSASYEDAVAQYTTALTLDPKSIDLLTKRSKARAGIGSWNSSLEDADAVIKLDPASPRGYERKHAALLGAHRYDEATDAYSNMLIKLEQSPDLATRESRNRYVSPSQTIVAIRNSVKRTQRDIPFVLINTETGRLYDEHERSSEFEADPAYKELVASTTTVLDNPRITQTVQRYFRYATFSHTWQGAEPLFHDVLREPVHKLAASPTVTKLMMFCVTVREAGLRWAWSDTCCINKTDGSVLQESLTSMFQWYHESALTIVHLKGVLSDSELGALLRCFWNTRAWTLQEFFASRVIRFYTEDWKPYLPGESAYNHKESSAIMSEMAVANGVDVEALLSLRPGSENVRQKLCLAATRTATKQEDMAYSLFGIFDVSIPVTYGEGQQRALGRLLQEVLTRSGDVTILAWTGKGSDYNSCLPAEIGVYRDAVSPFAPSLIDDSEMDGLVATLRTSSAHLDSVAMLYDRIVALPSPRLVSRRLSLSCVVFPVRGLTASCSDPLRGYRASTSALGNVEIKTTEDLSGLNNLALVHPWLQCLLDPVLPSEDVFVDDDVEPLTPIGDGEDDSDVFSPLPSPAVSSSYDKPTRALRTFARLRQPFGALLLVPLSHNEYKRVASDQLIVVQLLKNVSPRYLEQKIRTLDIL